MIEQPSMFDMFEPEPAFVSDLVAHTPAADVVVKSAHLSDCEKYRYCLSRTWGLAPPLVFVMLNPSIADSDIDDPTIRKCIGFAKLHACGGIVVVNLYAWRSTDPAGLKRATDPVGPDNDKWICSVLAGPNCDKVIVAWGAHARDDSRTDSVLKLIRLHGKKPLCLGYTNGSHPRHPLMLAYDTPIEEFK